MSRDGKASIFSLNFFSELLASLTLSLLVTDPDPDPYLDIWAIKATTNGSGSPSPGLYSAKLFDLTPQNVDMVLEDVRPYLVADGENIDVVSVDDSVSWLCLFFRVFMLRLS